MAYNVYSSATEQKAGQPQNSTNNCWFPNLCQPCEPSPPLAPCCPSLCLFLESLNPCNVQKFEWARFAVVFGIIAVGLSYAYGLFNSIVVLGTQAFATFPTIPATGVIPLPVLIALPAVLAVLVPTALLIAFALWLFGYTPATSINELWEVQVGLVTGAALAVVGLTKLIVAAIRIAYALDPLYNLVGVSVSSYPILAFLGINILGVGFLFILAVGAAYLIQCRQPAPCPVPCYTRLAWAVVAFLFGAAAYFYADTQEILAKTLVTAIQPLSSTALFGFLWFVLIAAGYVGLLGYLVGGCCPPCSETASVPLSFTAVLLGSWALQRIVRAGLVTLPVNPSLNGASFTASYVSYAYFPLLWVTLIVAFWALWSVTTTLDASVAGGIAQALASSATLFVFTQVDNIGEVNTNGHVYTAALSTVALLVFFLANCIYGASSEEVIAKVVLLGAFASGFFGIFKWAVHAAYWLQTYDLTVTWIICTAVLVLLGFAWLGQELSSCSDNPIEAFLTSLSAVLIGSAGAALTAVYAQTLITPSFQSVFFAVAVFALFAAAVLALPAYVNKNVVALRIVLLGVALASTTVVPVVGIVSQLLDGIFQANFDCSTGNFVTVAAGAIDYKNVYALLVETFAGPLLGIVLTTISGIAVFIWRGRTECWRDALAGLAVTVAAAFWALQADLAVQGWAIILGHFDPTAYAASQQGTSVDPTYLAEAVLDNVGLLKQSEAVFTGLSIVAWLAGLAFLAYDPIGCCEPLAAAGAFIYPAILRGGPTSILVGAFHTVYGALATNTGTSFPTTILINNSWFYFASDTYVPSFILPVYMLVVSIGVAAIVVQLLVLPTCSPRCKWAIWLLAVPFIGVLGYAPSLSLADQNSFSWNSLAYFVNAIPAFLSFEKQVSAVYFFWPVFGEFAVTYVFALVLLLIATLVISQLPVPDVNLAELVASSVALSSLGWAQFAFDTAIISNITNTIILQSQVDTLLGTQFWWLVVPVLVIVFIAYAVGQPCGFLCLPYLSTASAKSDNAVIAGSVIVSEKTGGSVVLQV